LRTLDLGGLLAKLNKQLLGQTVRHYQEMLAFLAQPSALMQPGPLAASWTKLDLEIVEHTPR
jgi:hypothetical protein